MRNFKLVDEILEMYSVKEINPFYSTKEELIKMWRSFPNYEERMKKWGLIAFELDK